MLKGKNAVVTGSTSGIGLGIARAFAKDGANVVINGFGPADEIEKERSGIEKDFGVKALYSPADMTKPAEIAGMIKLAETQLGSCDVLVNNAGIQHVAPIEEFPPEKWDQIIAINMTSAFHSIRAAVPGMKARKWGRIIQTASAHSLVASPFKSAYVTAKHGISGLTKTVALETATFGISAMFAGIDPEERFYFVHSYGVRRWELETEITRPPLVSWAEHAGDRFVAAVENGALWATQFHPEKSGDAGAQLLENWMRTL